MLELPARKLPFVKSGVESTLGNNSELGHS